MLSFITINPPGSFSTVPIRQWVAGINLEGRCHEYHPDGDFSQECYEFGVIKPNFPHHWEVPADGIPWKSLHFFFTPSVSMLPLLQFDEIRPGFMKLPLAESPFLYKVQRMLFKSHYLLNSHWLNCVDLAMNALEGALLWCRAEVERVQQKTDSRILTAIEYMNRHIAEKIYLEDIAKASFLSVPRLMSLFKANIGLSPMAYLDDERMERASKMLTTGYFSIKEIAAMTGYPDPAYFSKRFLQHFRMSPLAYRKKHITDV
ncbi:MAG TPA: AraC family transcriptional regulator [Phycisphaerae bacterium]|nr:AraC family transcriptional regulator [Phycisphaerae bacterium]HPS52007.1 AraC family transcriptional regulator [Phycisphaerae bacterium]